MHHQIKPFINSTHCYVIFTKPSSKFSTMLNYIDANISSKNGKPIWVSRYNFMCLLNVPKIMKYYGPMQNLWEGWYIGEGYIILVKPYICQGLKTIWEINMHKGMLESKFLHHSCRKFIRDNYNSSTASDLHRYGTIVGVAKKLFPIM